MSLSLFPETDPIEIRTLQVDPTHRLHLERYGNPKGRPVIVLHGGPGASWSPHVVRLFDPDHFHIVVFDQRGAYRSTPLGGLANNTTHDLIADIEVIRCLLGIDRWTVFGWSWGSALALAYAETHSDRCTALLVQGIVLFRPGFEQWDFHGSRDLFPEAFAELAAFAPKERRDELFPFYRDVILGDDQDMALEAAKNWYEFSDLLSNAHRIDKALAEDEETDAVILAGARISMHYWQNAAFLPPDALHDNAHHLSEIPGTILHGEQDFNCPIRAAYDLHAAWPKASFHAVPDAGHSIFEPEIVRCLLDALQRLKE